MRASPTRSASAIEAGDAPVRLARDVADRSNEADPSNKADRSNEADPSNEAGDAPVRLARDVADPSDEADQSDASATGAERAGRWGRDPARRPRWWLETLVVVWLLWVYDAVANLAALRPGAAVAHGLALLHFEERLHLDPERSLDQWLAHHHHLGLLTGDYYDNLHFIVTFAVVGWLWWCHPRQYRPLRTSLILINVIGFAVYWLYPVAPPRLLPGQHFSDIVALTHAIGGWHSGAMSKAANQFGAMPSLHLAWASWSTLAVWLVVRSRRWAPIVWIYPVLTVVVVMATGNHYLVDCAAGVATAALAFWTSRMLDRRMLDRRMLDRRMLDQRMLDRPRPDRRRRRSQGVASASDRTGVVSTPRAGKTAQITKAPA